MYGRVGKLAVLSKTQAKNPAMIGRKATRLVGQKGQPLGAHEGELVGKQTGSKVKFYWVGTRQIMVFVWRGEGGDYDAKARCLGVDERW